MIHPNVIEDGKRIAEKFGFKFTNLTFLVYGIDFNSKLLYSMQLSEEFLDHYFADIPKNTLIKTQNLSEEFIEKHMYTFKQYFCELCRFGNLSENFMRKYKDKIDFSTISFSQKLSENFIDEFKEYLNWEFICQYQTISENFIRNHIQFLTGESHWQAICTSQDLSENFVIEMMEFLDKFHCWGFIFNSGKFSEEFYKKYQNKVKIIKIYLNDKELESRYSDAELALELDAYICCYATAKDYRIIETTEDHLIYYVEEKYKEI